MLRWTLGVLLMAALLAGCASPRPQYPGWQAPIPPREVRVSHTAEGTTVTWIGRENGSYEIYRRLAGRGEWELLRRFGSLEQPEDGRYRWEGPAEAEPSRYAVAAIGSGAVRSPLAIAEPAR